jgi:hypothetical protein
MGLTILVSRTDQAVTVVQWFLDRSQFLDFACGPLLQFSGEVFRKIGYDLVHSHFKEYQVRDVSPAHLVPLYPPGEERRFQRFLKGQRPIRIGEDPPGRLRLIPMEFRGPNLGGLVSLPLETERSVPLAVPEEKFWRAFDEALGATE